MQRIGFSRRPTEVSPVAQAVHEPPPIYNGASRLIDWKNTARGGMTVDLGVRDVGPLDVHPFKGLPCGKEHGQRLRVIVREPSVLGSHPVSDRTPIYAGEAILMRWGDDSLTGMSTRLLLDAGPDGTNGKHPFEGMIAGRKEGELLEVIFWVIGDDERTQHPARIRRRTPFYELNEIKQSQILCRDQKFISFLAKNETNLVCSAIHPRPADDPVSFAAEVVRQHLGIESRSVLGHDTSDAHRARQRWRALMSHYFQNGWSQR